ncbi:hypothetical protein RUND412_011077 [Rhizina undulata]
MSVSTSPARLSPLSALIIRRKIIRIGKDLISPYANSFGNFLRDVMVPEYVVAPANTTWSPGVGEPAGFRNDGYVAYGNYAPRNILDFDAGSLQLNDVDFGLVGSFAQGFQPNMETMLDPLINSTDMNTMSSTTRSTAPNPQSQLQPSSQFSNEDESHKATSSWAKAFQQSLWVWKPQSSDSHKDYEQICHCMVPISPSNPQAQAANAAEMQLVELIQKCYISFRSPPRCPSVPTLGISGRDRIHIMVIQYHDFWNISKVPSSFPSVQFLDALVELFFNHQGVTTSRFLHRTVVKPVAETSSEVLGVVVMAGTSMTTLRSVRKFGYGLRGSLSKNSSALSLITVIIQISSHNFNAAIVNNIRCYAELTPPLTYSEQLWSAPNAEAWRNTYLAAPPPNRHSTFIEYFLNFSTYPMSAGVNWDFPLLTVLNKICSLIWQYHQIFAVRSAIHSVGLDGLPGGRVTKDAILTSRMQELRGVLGNWRIKAATIIPFSSNPEIWTSNVDRSSPGRKAKSPRGIYTHHSSAMLGHLYGKERTDGAGVEKLRGGKLGVSRIGSGSYVMGYVLAHREGWLEEGKDPFECVVLNDFLGLRKGVSDGTADAFMWEHFTSKRYYDLGQIRKIGQIYIPWPSWHIVARAPVLADPAGAKAIAEFLDGLNKGVRFFLENQGRTVEYIAANLN